MLNKFNFGRKNIKVKCVHCIEDFYVFIFPQIIVFNLCNNKIRQNNKNKVKK